MALSAQEKRAVDSDLIKLPQDHEGANCGNCKYLGEKWFCKNKEIQMTVAANMCCNYHDSDVDEPVVKQ